MKRISCLLLGAILAFGCNSASEENVEPFITEIPDNAGLVADEDGWITLFDGKTFDGWRGFRSLELPAGWKITQDGELHFNGNGKGDIMTAHQFASMEFELEWKVSLGGNSGIFYWVTEDDSRTYRTGPEMQVLDNSKHKDGKNPLTSAGSNYALQAPPEDVTAPVGEYNKVRIVINGDHVEHWLNGVKLLEYEAGSEAWQALVAKSKFNKMPNYGKNRKGHIALQDHGDPVWYRNIRVRLFEAEPASE